MRHHLTLDQVQLFVSAFELLLRCEEIRIAEIHPESGFEVREVLIGQFGSDFR